MCLIGFSDNPSACKNAHTGWSPNAWVGARRTHDNCSTPLVWKQSDRVQIPLNYTYFFKYEPNCDQGLAHCLHITQTWSYRWNDHLCEDRKCAICQRRFEKVI